MSRGQDHATFLASAAQTATQTQADQDNQQLGAYRGIKVILDVTVPGTGSVTVSIQGKDPTSGKYYPILTGGLVTTQVTNVYTVYPELVAVANVTASDTLPRFWRIVVTANNANSMTYSVGYDLLP